MQIRRSIFSLSLFLAFVAGLFVSGLLSSKSLDTWNMVIQDSYRIEQDIRANRAEREGDLATALHHQRNVFEASSRDWLYLLEKWEEPSPWYLIGLLAFDQMYPVDAPVRNSKKAQAAVRGHYALLLERNGFDDQAREEWVLGAEAYGSSSVDSFRNMIITIRESRSTDDFTEIETLIIGP